MLNARVNSATTLRRRGGGRRPGAWGRIGGRHRDRDTDSEALDHRSSLCQSARPDRRSRCVPGPSRDSGQRTSRAATAQCLCWVAVAIRQIQRSIVVLRQQRGCVANAARLLPPIWVLSTAAICSYLWTTWEAVARVCQSHDLQTQSQAQTRICSSRLSLESWIPFQSAASVLITTKNNDRLRLLEAIWKNKILVWAAFWIFW